MTARARGTLVVYDKNGKELATIEVLGDESPRNLAKVALYAMQAAKVDITGAVALQSTVTVDCPFTEEMHTAYRAGGTTLH